MSELGYQAVDDLFAQRFAEGMTPGLVYGVVAQGEIVHAGALGTTALDRAEPPTVDSVFRIASMTKSFTASAVLLLRDRGALRLDDPAVQYVPEFGNADVTIRHLLTMSGGLLTDDPWGDRQESLSHADFGALLAEGLTVGRAPGLGFEYSNTGYALLGRIITAITGGYHPFVEHELLEPLGMASTRFDPTGIGATRVPGHVKRNTGWVELDPIGPGAYSAMGGLHSSVGDLARWVSGFVSAFHDAPDRHPLAKSSRREMQQLHRFASVDATLGTPAGLGAVAMGYGYGLFVQHDSQLGQFAMHSGGYPGYGSRMAWHPASQLGVVTMSNGTYAGAYQQADEALRLLVRRHGVPTPTPTLARLDSWIARVTDRIAAFDPDEAWIDPELMAPNVELDSPDDERRRRLAEAQARVGAPNGPASEPFGRAMAHAAWIVPAERGRYDVEILLTPEPRPRLQTVSVTAVALADSAVVDRIRVALDGPGAELLRACGTPELITQPVTADEFLVGAGATWWKARVRADVIAFEPHPASAYPRLAWLARVLRPNAGE